MKVTLRALALTLAVVSVCVSVAQATQFGRNKVQYGTFSWSVAHTEHFDVYFYEGSEELADAVSTIAESANSRFEDVLGHKLSTVIPIIVYASHNDFQQTNVSSSHIGETVGGFTELFKNRVVVPFTGSYDDLRHVVYHELTHVFMFDIVYGGLVESVIRQAYMNPVPLWFVEGLAEYVSTGWDSEAEMILRDLTISDMVVPVEYLSGGYLVYKEGQSVLCFIADTYGPRKIEEMVRTVSKTHNLERALMDATGLTTPELSEQWQSYLNRRYWPEIADRNRGEDTLTLLTDHSRDNSYLNLGPSVSPDGQRVAFVTDRSGYSDIYVISALDGSVLSKPVRGERSDDFETLHVLRPGSSWSPDGERLCFIAKSGATDALHVVDAESGRVELTLRFPLDGMFTPSWSPDGEKIVFVGTEGGASDLYITGLDGGDAVRLTDDFFDEQDPEWSPDGRSVVFASDRNAPAREDLKRTYDIFILDVESGGVRPLVLTAANEQQPTWSPDGRSIAYVSDEDGSPQLHLADLDSSTTFQATNLVGGVSSPSWARDADRMVFSIYERMGWDIAVVKDPIEAFSSTSDSIAHHPSIDPAYVGGEATAVWDGEYCASIPTADEEGGESLDDTDRLVMVGATESGPDGSSVPEKPENGGDTNGGGAASGGEDNGRGHGGGQESEAVARARSAYQKATAATRRSPGVGVTMSDEGERKAGTVEKYTPRFSPDWVSGGFAYTSGYGFSGAAQIAVSDVLGNHRFYIASNFLSSIESSSFEVLYEQLAHRVNYSLAVYNFKDYYYSDRTFLGEDLGEKRYFTERSYGLTLGLSYPFSMFTRVDFDVSALSVDRQYAAENEEGLIELTDEGVARSLVIPSLRLVNDTTLWGSVGPISGGRSSLAVQRAWESGGSFSYLTGIADVRRYLRIGARHSLAVKLVAARSTSANAQSFFIGGVNSLRGYDDFSIRGTNLALTSLEFRYPFIDHLQIASPIPLSLWGLRGVMFLDMGAAWDDGFRGVTSEGGSRRLKDIRASHGVGVRMNLSMFVVRVDWAWPTDFHTAGDLVTHFALGAEF
ncbi:MAG: PD40 domain-containing protein [Candidatus Eisenbacteria bacterium]|nr:PD40 domain-containing protein [Candidatus Eisenbacteria bacterium]